jgi:hypothetical protein
MHIRKSPSSLTSFPLATQIQREHRKAEAAGTRAPVKPNGLPVKAPKPTSIVSSSSLAIPILLVFRRRKAKQTYSTYIHTYTYAKKDRKKDRNRASRQRGKQHTQEKKKKTEPLNFFQKLVFIIVIRAGRRGG